MNTARRYIEQMFLDIWGDEFYNLMRNMTDEEIMADIVEVGQLGHHLAHASVNYHTNTLRNRLGVHRREGYELLRDEAGEVVGFQAEFDYTKESK